MPAPPASPALREESCRFCQEGGALLANREPAVLSCPSCGLIYLRDVASAESRESLYQEDYYREETGARFLGVFELLVAFFRRLRMWSVLRREPGPASLLDIGCGRGIMVELFQKRGWRAVGTQLSRTAAEAARAQRGVEVVVGDLPDLHLQEQSFRVVTLYHVLEHVPRPDRYLREIHRLLEDDGLLVVEVPNHAGLAFRLLGARHFCFDHPNHLVFFTPRSLAKLLRREGFRIVGRTFFSLEYSPFSTLQNMLNFIPGPPNLFYRSLMTTAEGRGLRTDPMAWMHAFLACILALPALLLSLTSLLLPVGNTVRFVCRRGKG
jgi:2-polyprenyl-3-methyl-5-hydroxy-6-metoxy-1,4-benzoquinol methylase